MVRNYERKSERSKWSEPDLDQAIKDVKEKKHSLKAAIVYNIPKSILERHVNSKVSQPGKAKLGHFVPALDSSFKNKLLEHVKKMQCMFFGLTTDSLRELAFQLAEANGLNVPFNKSSNKAGKDWLFNFLKRHPELSFRQPEHISLSRASGFNRVQVGRFFELLRQTLMDNGIAPTMIYNVD